ncbi:hypothetical protein V502_07168 [Pseudogymnoascus sp. VKM F-4520 (FW-2644)]|nr:hypothetical protein V502_07168 [Pseudogymnoascus sp. VKM F-4520 (FW-2644)]
MVPQQILSWPSYGFPSASNTTICDDEADKSRELVKMGAIYRFALLTIYAKGSSNSQSGLFTRRDGRIYTPTEQDTETAEPMLASASDGLDYLEERGWVLQETVLSSRRLAFGKWMSWKCTTARAMEKRPLLRDRHSALTDGFASEAEKLRLWIFAPSRMREASRQSWLRWNQFDSWYAIVETYSVTNLTYVSDNLPALSGLAQLFQRAHSASYAAGLWIEDLQSGLTWYVASNDERKVPWHRNLAPSWSWAAVGKVRIKFRSWPSKSTHVVSEGVKLLEAVCLPEIPLNPYGTIKKGALKLRIRMRKALLRCNAEFTPRRTQYDYISWSDYPLFGNVDKRERPRFPGLVLDIDSNQAIGEAALDMPIQSKQNLIDSLDMSLEVMSRPISSSEKEVWCGLVHVQETKERHHLTALVLEPELDSTLIYRRLGLLFLTDRSWFGLSPSDLNKFDHGTLSSSLNTKFQQRQLQICAGTTFVSTDVDTTRRFFQKPVRRPGQQKFSAKALKRCQRPQVSVILMDVIANLGLFEKVQFTENTRDITMSDTTVQGMHFYETPQTFIGRPTFIISVTAAKYSTPANSLAEKGSLEATVTLTFLTAKIFPLISIIRLHENNPTVWIERSSKNPLKHLIAAADNCWVDSDVVSCNHARLMFDSYEEKIFIEDTKSTHGTYINNNQIPKYGPVPLANNDIISLGAEIKLGNEMYPECRFRVNYELVPFLAPKELTNEKEVGCEVVEISDDELCDLSLFVSDDDDEIQRKDSLSTTIPASKTNTMPGSVDAIEGDKHLHDISLVDSQPVSDNSDDGNEASEDIGGFSDDDVLTACEVFKPEFEAPVAAGPAVSPSNPRLPGSTTEGPPQLLNPKPITQLPQIKHAITQTMPAPPPPMFRFSVSVELAAHQTGTGPLKLTVVVGESSGASFSLGYLAPEPHAHNPPNEPDSNNSGTAPKDTVSMEEKWPREPALKRKRDAIANEALQY